MAEKVLKKEGKRRCAICKGKLADCNPQNVCFRHEFKPDWDPKGDEARRASVCSSGASGNIALKTYVDENGGFKGL